MSAGTLILVAYCSPLVLFVGMLVVASVVLIYTSSVAHVPTVCKIVAVVVVVVVVLVRNTLLPLGYKVLFVVRYVAAVVVGVVVVVLLPRLVVLGPCRYVLSLVVVVVVGSAAVADDDAFRGSLLPHLSCPVFPFFFPCQCCVCCCRDYVLSVCSSLFC